MKKMLAALVATVAVATPLTLIATAPAEAAGCSTQTQYRQVHNGMSLLRVQQIMRAPGYVVASGANGSVQWQLREWQKCAGGIFDYDIGFLRGPFNVTHHVGWYVSLQ